MAAYAALLSLMNNIEQIQRHTRFPISFDQKQSESLLDKVSFLIDFLESYNYHAACEEMKDLESRITDAAYAVEDIIETHVVDTIDSHSRLVNELIHLTQLSGTSNPTFSDLLNLLSQLTISPVNDSSSSSIHVGKNVVIGLDHELTESTERLTGEVSSRRIIPMVGMGSTEKNPTVLRLPGIEKVMEDMDFIKEEAMKIKDKREINGLQTTSPIIDHSSSSIHVGKNAMIGFDNELMELMKRLKGDGSSHQIIAIVGMGGMGKTTLAKTAYEKPLVVNYFDIRAWVSISQEYSFRRILLGLLGNEYNQMSDDQLGQRLYQSLFGRRYLVVLDDMWSVEAWEMVKVFLPKDKNGSRIIVTTRISSLAPNFGGTNLKMNFLDDDTSWNLLCEKVFGQEGCPRELQEVGRTIVKNCQGLPLSIVVIGGLLAKSERSKEHWEYIAQGTEAVINLEGDEMCTKILYLSYENLPVSIKPCFLYMGVFSEDEIISVRLLIKLWIAEGFLKPNSSKELEVVAREYINDLISRNLILVRTYGLNGKIKSCMIHDLLRNLCLRESQNEKFMYVPKVHIQDEVKNIGSKRRISIRRSLHIPKHLDIWKPELLGRSLVSPMALPLQNFKLLRVLKGYDGDDSDIYSLGDTLKLVNSRVIVIKTIERPDFPTFVNFLWNLQVLIVKGIQEGPLAPLEIWEMTELTHLQFEKVLYLPDPLPSQEGDAVVMKLHTLKYIADFMFSNEVVKRIPNIKILNTFYTLTGKELEKQGLKYLGLLKNLESLTLSFRLQTGSDLLSYLTFPNALKKLSLQGCGLHWEDMSMIGSLPYLEVLKLNSFAFIGPEWVLVEEGFSCLKYLQISYCQDLVHWIAEDVHFPCLEHLQLIGLDNLVEIPSGIGDILTLQKIVLYDCSKSAVISARKILEEQEDLGNMDVQVTVVCNKDPELESLPSDNFLVVLVPL